MCPANLKEIRMTDGTYAVDNTENIISNLRGQVVTLLVTQYEFEIEEAEEAVETSVTDSPSIWNENSEAKVLARILASDGDSD